MNKYISRLIIRDNETKTFRGVKPVVRYDACVSYKKEDSTTALNIATHLHDLPFDSSALEISKKW